ncbi:hypothetical protein HYZ99_01515, partial [Candidatus Peregrinibacteria bacterium]|nr:hypothetical protein [Candidatus Peregrinibacteria bacterium]
MAEENGAAARCCLATGKSGHAPHAGPISPLIPLQTRTLSSLRDFFLSRKSLATFAVLGVLAGGITYGLYRSNVHLNTERIRERALAIAATGAVQFDPVDLNELRTPADITKPQYAKVIYKLNEIRRQNEDVKYIYIMRPTADPNTLEFVADADSLDPYAKKDLNGDGIVDEADWLSPPGEPYDIAQIEEIHEMFVLKKPIADQEPYTDQWGTFISDHAPVKDDKKNIVAMIGVDIFADKAHELTRSTFTPIIWFIGLFLLLVVIRLTAFNRSLFKELWELLRFKKKSIFVSLSLNAILSTVITFGIYQYTLNLMKEEIGNRLIS